MPISVTCDGCSASFKVKDEYAGKRAKCPKCANPITIPAVVADFEVIEDEPTPAPKVAAKPAPAKPVVVSKPKPVLDDEADEPPVNPKRKRGADSDDDEPVSPNRKRGTSAEDADDDKPTAKRRRRDDDDEPKKKKSALPLILGILVGLLLVCGGGGAALWFFVIEPAMNPQWAKNTDPTTPGARGVRPPTGGGNVQPQTRKAEFGNMVLVRSGMTLAQVEAAIGGKGEKVKSSVSVDMIFAIGNGPDSKDVSTRWASKVESGHVMVWKCDLLDRIAVAFSDDPDAGGTVVGVVGRNTGGAGSEPIKLPGKVGPAPGSDVNPNAPVATLTADELSRDYMNYLDKYVIVTGVAANDAKAIEHSLADVKLVQSASGKMIKFNSFPRLTTDVKKGDPIEVWGLISPTSMQSGFVQFFKPVNLKPADESLTAAQLLDAYAKDAKAAEKKYRYRGMITVSGTVKKIGEKTITVEEGKIDGKPARVVAEFFNDEFPTVKVGDPITVHCTVEDFKQEKSGEQVLGIGFCRLALPASKEK